MGPSRRAAAIGLSPTLAVNDRARELRAAGVDVIDLSAGQPDFPTPEPVKRAGVRAIEENRTRYTPNAGEPALRQAIAERVERDHGLRYAPAQVIVSPGAKASLFFACQALLDPGDRALVPSPYWTSYPEQVRLAGADPVFVPCAEAAGFKLHPADVERAAVERTRLVILNSPCNPTGTTYTTDELAALAEVCLRRGLWIVSDEIYGKLVYDGQAAPTIAATSEAARARTILIDGLSKSHSMTGWRIGYALGPLEIVSAMARIQSHVTSNATTISQWAGIAALALDEAALAPRIDAFRRRRDATVTALRAIPGLTCVEPRGAFYAFPNVSGLAAHRPGGIALSSGAAVARYLLEAARVAVVPGEAFGSPDHVRLSFALELERLEQGLERIAKALAGAAR